MKSYNKFYYENNKNQILIDKRTKCTNNYFNLNGHLKPIHDAIRRYAKKWHLDIDSLKIFKRWAVMDSTYEELFKVWKEANFSKEFTPVVMRKIKCKGFVINNLYWSTKGKHPWWTNEVKELREFTLKKEKVQVKANESTDEWKKERIQAIKQLRKKE